MHSETCLPTYNLVSMQFSACKMSAAIEISTILATPNVTKINDIWKYDVFLTF